MGVRACGDFLKAGLVVFVVRAHEAVPVVEVEAVVAAHLLVMLDVVGRRVQQLAEPRFHEPGGEVFIAGVTDDIEDNLPDHEGKERQRMHGHGEDQQREDAGLHEGLQRCEGIRGPGAGVGALVMHAVEELEETAVMHEPVRPVKPGVMHDDGDADAGHEPHPAMRVDLPIHLPAVGFADQDRRDADEAIHECGEHRPLHLPPHIGRRWITLDDLPPPPVFFEDHIGQQPCHRCHQRVAQPVFQRDAEEHLHGF